MGRWCLTLAFGLACCGSDEASTASDAGVDALVDVVAGTDFGVDAMPDVLPDVALDVAADVAADLAVDVPEPDAGPEPSLANNFLVEESEGHPDCDGLMPARCMLPVPNDRWLVDDAQGRRLLFGATSLPANVEGQPMRADTLAAFDGWGVASPIYMELPGATLTGLPGVFDPASSLEPAARTLIIDSVTGERVAHWAELDHLTFDAESPLLILRSAIRFADDRRYVVAVRGVVDTTGTPLEPSPGFAALRDRMASDVSGVHARRAHFEADVFPVLAEAGVERGELLLAFDFTTATGGNGTDLLVGMRDRMLELVGAAGPTYTIDEVQEVDHPHTRYKVRGRAQVPSFLLPVDDELRWIRLDDHGLPVAEGTEEVPFDLWIPHSAFDGGEPMALVQYGHGLLGGRSEAGGGYLREMGDTYRFMTLALDLQGMATADAAAWAYHLGQDASAFPVFAQKPLQGLVNHLALVRMMKGGFLAQTDPRLQRPDGTPLYDPERVFYYGNSQGGTMGTIVMALTTDVERGVLGVPGGVYPFLLQRSTTFSDLLGLLTLAYEDPTDVALVLGLLGTGFSRLEPLTYAPHIVRDMLPGTPAHDVLMHVARGDTQVHNQVSFIMGRGVGVPLMTPAVRSVWGFPEVPFPVAGSAMVEHDFQMPENPDPLRPLNPDYDTHGHLRNSTFGQQQMMHFLYTGEVANFCDGACDPD